MNGNTSNTMEILRIQWHSFYLNTFPIITAGPLPHPAFWSRMQRTLVHKVGQCRSNIELDRAEPAIKLRGDIDLVSNLGGMFESLLEDPDGAEQLGNVPKVGNNLSLNTIYYYLSLPGSAALVIKSLSLLLRSELARSKLVIFAARAGKVHQVYQVSAASLLPATFSIQSLS